MHTGNIDTLESPFPLIETDTFMNNSLLVCVDKVLHSKRWLIRSSNTNHRRNLCNLCSSDDLLPNKLKNSKSV